MLLTVITLCCLLWMAVDEWGGYWMGKLFFAASAAAAATTTSLDSTLEGRFHLLSDCRSPAAIAAVPWLVKVHRGIGVAPLRHHVAVILALAVCIAVSTVMSILGKQSEQLLVNSYNAMANYVNSLVEAVKNTEPDYDTLPPIGQALFDAAKEALPKIIFIMNNYGIYIAEGIERLTLWAHSRTARYSLAQIFPCLSPAGTADILWAVVGGASFACAVVALSMSASYADIYADRARFALYLCRERNRIAGGPSTLLLGGGGGGDKAVATPSNWASTELALAAHSLVAAEEGKRAYWSGEGKAGGDSAEVGGAGVGVARPTGEDVLLQGWGCLRRASACASAQWPHPYKADGITLDLDGRCFAYSNAFAYASLYLIK